MSDQAIKQIRKRFKNEWLLIRVTKMDDSTTTPLKGRLVAHSPDRDLIFRKSIGFKGHFLIDRSSDPLPKIYAFAF